MSDEDSVSLPLVHRILLKFPLLSLEGFSDRFQGLFWAVGVPALLTVYFFGNMLFFACLRFPLNCLAVFGVTVLVCLFIIRIYLERMLPTRKAFFEGYEQRHIQEVLADYMDLCEKQKKTAERSD